jgi:hypothetical protein
MWRDKTEFCQQRDGWSQSAQEGSGHIAISLFYARGDRYMKGNVKGSERA